MPINNTHPSAETLRAFALGKLADADAEVVLGHLNDCPGCLRKASSLSGDSFLGRLRSVHQHGDTQADQTLPPRTTDLHQPEGETSGPVRRSSGANASASWSPETFPAPFGRYTIRKLLGEGGMGAVYLANDSQLDRQVALKIPHFAAADGPMILERFYREARAAATVLHPNICPVHDVGEINGTPYLTMAYVEGKPLADIAAARPLSQRQTAILVRKLALALQEAHKRDVIHRDLKPANIMIDQRGEPMIMDFGLARRIRGADSRLTQKGSILGTPAYMSPEQISGDLEATGPASDIYSLGVTFYELLTGRLPFHGDPMAMLSQVLLDEPPPPSKVRKGIDPHLEAICCKAMAKKVEDRYESMAQLAAVLTDALRARSPSQAKTAVEDSHGSRAAASARPPGQRRFPLWGWLTGVGVGVMLLVIVILWSSGVLEVKAKNGTIDAGDRRTINVHLEPIPLAQGTARTSKNPVVKVDLPKEITNSIGMKLVLIPKGRFMMGSPREENGRGWTEDPHEVEITKPFYMGVYTVTQAEYEKVMGTNPSYYSPTGHARTTVMGINTSQFPVEQVNWFDAVEFCKKLTAMEKEKEAKRTYRLPTEAEWEYACRAGTKTAFNCGDSLAGKANFGAMRRGTCKVGSYAPNAWGLCDMHGNLWQWCSDWFAADYYTKKVGFVQDPQGPESGTARVLRGGHWRDKEMSCRSANRSSNDPTIRRTAFDGFRVVCVPAGAK